jgi:hypothetical protein
MIKVTLRAGSQNGSILEAIKTWRRNVDKHFAGCGLCAVAPMGLVFTEFRTAGSVEECPICYATVHGVTRQLPRMSCPQCKHKFHSVSACVATLRRAAS